MFEINEWSKEDILLQEKLSKILKNVDNIKLLSLEKLCVVRQRSEINIMIKEITDRLDPVEKYFLKNLKECYGFISIKEKSIASLILFTEDVEFDVLIVQFSIPHIEISKDNWIIISIDPFLISSKYGAILGLIENENFYSVVILDEGDDGWSELRSEL